MPAKMKFKPKQNGNNGKRGDSKLIISFENKPRIATFSSDGSFISKVKIRNLKNKMEVVYMLVAEEEADLKLKKIS